MNKWNDNQKRPLEKNGVSGDVYEVHYMDVYNVLRYASGLNGYPFGVYADGVSGSKFPGAQRGAWGELSEAIPYGRIKRWRRK